jgi:hypothetical protein
MQHEAVVEVGPRVSDLVASFEHTVIYAGPSQLA